MSGKVCLDCAKPLGRANRSGRCCRCFPVHLGADPAFRRARADGIRAKFANDPAHRAKMADVARRNSARWRQDPAAYAQLVAHGRRQIAALHSPAAKATSLAARGVAGRKITETRLGWCPPAYREAYRKLCRSQRLTAAAARAEILGRVAREQAHVHAILHAPPLPWWTRDAPRTGSGRLWLAIRDLRQRETQGDHAQARDAQIGGART